MKMSICLVGAMILASGSPVLAQHHMSNWVHRTATDTTIVYCRTDSLTAIAFPPNSMNMMMMPDSMYCRIDRMNMDSLYFPHDSTFIGWYRVQAGRDSLHFDMMNGDSVYGHHTMMQFMNAALCWFHWDSLMSDLKHRSWHVTGMRGWNGSSWETMTGVNVSGDRMTFANTQLYAAVAFVGTPTNTTGIVDRGEIPGEFTLYQNYPNPFNPSTTIRFTIPKAAFVRLEVYNLLGQRVASLVSGNVSGGVHEISWNAGNVSSGVYVYRLAAGNLVQSKGLVLAR
jgi:hypothetical protein